MEGLINAKQSHVSQHKFMKTMKIPICSWEVLAKSGANHRGYTEHAMLCVHPETNNILEEPQK